MKLTKEQQEVVLHLDKGMFVWTNEGEGFEAWIGGVNAERVKVIDVHTADFLNTHRIIKFVDGDYPLGLFKYELANAKEI